MAYSRLNSLFFLLIITFYGLFFVYLKPLYVEDALLDFLCRAADFFVTTSNKGTILKAKIAS